MIIDIISSVGFPIAISLWFMVRTEKVIINNTNALLLNIATIQKCKLKIKKN
jgi:hypothetical protein